MMSEHTAHQGDANERNDISPAPSDFERDAGDPPELDQDSSDVRTRAGSNAPSPEETDGGSVEQRTGGELAEPEELTAEEVAEEIAEDIHTRLVSMERRESYSGLLPDGENWHKYEDATKERILRMSEAFTTDESARRDKLVEAQVTEAKAGRRNALWLMAACIAAALLSMFITGNPYFSASFVALPVIWGAISFLPQRKKRSDD